MTAPRIRLLGLLVTAALLGACGGGGSGDAPRGLPDTPPAPRTVHGRVAKGPLRDADVRLYALDGGGERASGEPLAQARTAPDGAWSVELPAGSGALLVESSGGAYVDESDPEPDAALKRTVTLADGEGFSAVLPADADTVALTLYSNALLLKARRETVGGEFLAVLDNNRALQRAAYGFDPLTTLPADPIAPEAGSDDDSRAYALALGGAAQALNAVAIGLGQATPSFALIAALVDDLSDCTLDGAAFGAPVNVPLDGASAPLPASDLAREILRFRNNNFAAYAQTPLLVPDAQTCALSGAAPDTIAPTVEHVPDAFTVAAVDASGTPADDPVIADVLARIEAADDRPAAVTLSDDAPEQFPLGETLVTFVATDAAGNVAQASVRVTVADLTPPVILAPAGVTVAQTDALTPVALGVPSVSDNVTAAAQLVVDNDAPAGFAPGITTVTWTVRDAVGLAASATQSVTVLASNADSDGDGLSDAGELAAGTDPARPDSDTDGVGDGLELRVGSDPTLAAAHVYYVSPDGDDAASGDGWASAKAHNAGLGLVPPGASAAQPSFVLYAGNAGVSASAAWALMLMPPCDHIVLIGSLAPDLLEPRPDAAGGPTTTFALAGGAGVVLEDCANVQLHDVAITGAGAGAVRITGGSAVLERVHLRENASTTNGAGLAALDASVAMRASVVAGNSSDASGGGVHAEGGAIVIEHSTISGNRAAASGGGIALVDTGADSRIHDSLIAVNGAQHGGGVALASSAGTGLGNLTLAYNEARDAGAGAGLVFDRAGSGPRLVDSVFAGNRDGAGGADSVEGLDGSMSSFNLLEEAPIGPDDLDVSAGGAGLVAGYYLDQAASPGVDSGSRSAAAAALDTRYTDPATDAAQPDSGTVDRGYHYAGTYAPADDFAIDVPLGTIIEPAGGVRVTPLREGAALGSGHQVVVSLGLDLVDLVSSANVDPLGNGRSVALGDLGNGDYAFDFGEPRAIGETTMTVRVDDVALARTLVVIVKTCDEPPPACQRPHGDVTLRPVATKNAEQDGDDPHKKTRAIGR